MIAAARAVWALALTLAACSRATDVYVGSDLDPPAAGVAGEQAPPPAAGPVVAGAAAPPQSSATPPRSAQPPPSVAPPPPDSQPIGCAVGTADCDGMSVTGCETDITSDPLHCGGCDSVCEAQDCSCIDGQRVIACPSGREDCDGDPGNGCETDLTSDVQSCGSCGRVCVATGAGVGSVRCQDSACVVACQAPALRGDCDGDPDNGCETDLFHDPNNCGSCGMQCAVCADTRCL